MASWRWNAFCVSGPLWEESTGKTHFGLITSFSASGKLFYASISSHYDIIDTIICANECIPPAELAQERRANALELCLSCTNSSICNIAVQTKSPDVTKSPDSLCATWCFTWYSISNKSDGAMLYGCLYVSKNFLHISYGWEYPSILGDDIFHDDVIRWKHFPHNWPFVRGIHRPPVNSLHKGQWRGALMFSLICVWINDWVNNREAGDLRRYHAHYDVIVMYRHVCRDLLIVSRVLATDLCGIVERWSIFDNRVILVVQK